MSAIADTIPRVALVTGAARRIGRVVAEDLAAAGFRVAVHYSTSEIDAQGVATRIGGLAFRADLGCENQTAGLIERVEAEFGPVGVLINNASLFERDEVLDATRQSWDRHIETNLRAPFVLTQDLARRLPAGAEGVVINLLDQRVWNLTPHFISYTLSKAGLWTLTQTLALALAPRVRVAGIGPGPTLASSRQDPAHFTAQCAATPLGRGADPAEIARAVHFILSAPSFTGQMIALDGGQHLDWAPGSGTAEE